MPERFLIAILLLCVGTPASAQRIRGAAVTPTGEPIADVTIEISRPDGTELPALRTDSTGLFSVLLPAPGRYELRASRIGYTPVGPVELMAERQRDLEVLLRMSTEAIVLNPVEVTVRRAARTQIEEVHARIEWVRKLGVGRTMVREEIESRSAPTLPALVASMSPRIRTVAPVTGRETILLSSPRHEFGVCQPAMYVDGIPAAGLLDHNYVRPEHLEAVEMYIGAAQIPAQFRDGRDCGVVLFWTRRGADPDAPALTYRRVLFGIGIALLILFFGTK